MYFGVGLYILALDCLILALDVLVFGAGSMVLALGHVVQCQILALMSLSRLRAVDFL